MKPQLIHTRGDGTLGDTQPETVRAIARAVARSPHTVIHLHGGLVDKQSAIDAAARLSPHYAQHGLNSVFFIWESGLFETLRNNAKEIFDEKLFRSLLKHLLKWAGGMVLNGGGGRATTGATPLDDLSVETAVAEARSAAANDAATSPLLQVRPREPVQKSTSSEEKKFSAALVDNREFREAFDALMLGLGENVPTGRSSAHAPAPARSLISDSVKKELRATVQEGDRALFDPVVLVAKAVAVLARVLRRFAENRDHGLYTTVVEELLRELYIDVIGSKVWTEMKKDTAQTFQAPGRGGSLFLAELSDAVRANSALPKLSVVGHSAGSIFASYLMIHLERLRRAGDLPVIFALHRLVFLAPACRTDLWREVLAIHDVQPLFERFRMYSLSDGLEAGYWELPPLYPRSLLYIISGLLEHPENDANLLGMQRYSDREDTYTGPELADLRTFLRQSERTVWSEHNGPDGLTADAIRHGGFCDTSAPRNRTMSSVAHFLAT